MESSKLDCLLHPAETVIFFCCNPECFMPLCSQCLSTHSDMHFRKASSLNLQSIREALASSSASFEQLRARYNLAQSKQEQLLSSFLEKLSALRVSLEQSLARVIEEAKAKVSAALEESRGSEVRPLIEDLLQFRQKELQNLVKFSFEKETLKTQVLKFEITCQANQKLPQLLAHSVGLRLGQQHQLHLREFIKAFQPCKAEAAQQPPQLNILRSVSASGEQTRRAQIEQLPEGRSLFKQGLHFQARKAVPTVILTPRINQQPFTPSRGLSLPSQRVIYQPQTQRAPVLRRAEQQRAPVFHRVEQHQPRRVEQQRALVSHKAEQHQFQSQRAPVLRRAEQHHPQRVSFLLKATQHQPQNQKISSLHRAQQHQTHGQRVSFLQRTAQSQPHGQRAHILRRAEQLQAPVQNTPARLQTIRYMSPQPVWTQVQRVAHQPEPTRVVAQPNRAPSPMRLTPPPPQPSGEGRRVVHFDSKRRELRGGSKLQVTTQMGSIFGK